jgi:hypothetical protein
MSFVTRNLFVRRATKCLPRRFVNITRKYTSQFIPPHYHYNQCIESVMNDEKLTYENKQKEVRKYINMMTHIQKNELVELRKEQVKNMILKKLKTQINDVLEKCADENIHSSDFCLKNILSYKILEDNLGERVMEAFGKKIYNSSPILSQYRWYAEQIAPNARR